MHQSSIISNDESMQNENLQEYNKITIQLYIFLKKRVNKYCHCTFLLFKW